MTDAFVDESLEQPTEVYNTNQQIDPSPSNVYPNESRNLDVYLPLVVKMDAGTGEYTSTRRPADFANIDLYFDTIETLDIRASDLNALTAYTVYGQVNKADGSTHYEKTDLSGDNMGDSPTQTGNVEWDSLHFWFSGCAPEHSDADRAQHKREVPDQLVATDYATHYANILELFANISEQQLANFNVTHDFKYSSPKDDFTRAHVVSGGGAYNAKLQASLVNVDTQLEELTQAENTKGSDDEKDKHFMTLRMYHPSDTSIVHHLLHTNTNKTHTADANDVDGGLVEPLRLANGAGASMTPEDRLDARPPRSSFNMMMVHYLNTIMGGSVNHNLVNNPDAISKKFETQKLEQKLLEALLLSGNVDAWNDGDSNTNNPLFKSLLDMTKSANVDRFVRTKDSLQKDLQGNKWVSVGRAEAIDSSIHEYTELDGGLRFYPGDKINFRVHIDAQVNVDRTDIPQKYEKYLQDTRLQQRFAYPSLLTTGRPHGPSSKNVDTFSADGSTYSEQTPHGVVAGTVDIDGVAHGTPILDESTPSNLYHAATRRCAVQIRLTESTTIIQEHINAAQAIIDEIALELGDENSTGSVYRHLKSRQEALDQCLAGIQSNSHIHATQTYTKPENYSAMDLGNIDSISSTDQANLFWNSADAANVSPLGLVGSIEHTDGGNHSGVLIDWEMWGNQIDTDTVISTNEVRVGLERERDILVDDLDDLRNTQKILHSYYNKWNEEKKVWQSELKRRESHEVAINIESGSV